MKIGYTARVKNATKQRKMRMTSTSTTVISRRWIYAEALYKDGSATLDDLREAVTMLDDIARTARQVLGGSHPTTTGIEGELEDARAALRASG